MSRFKTIGFVGGGRATRFLLEGWRRAGRLPSDLVVSDPNGAVLKALQADFPSVRAGDNRAAAGAALVVLAVHPPVMGEVLSGLRGALSAEAAVLSLAPKTPIAAIRSALGVSAVARMIPNAPSALGKGFNPVTYGSSFAPETRAALADLFAAWGEAPEVPEEHLEAYAVISGMGPTYFWFQWQTLSELAQEFGLPPEPAAEALRSTVRGAADLLFSSPFTPAEVMDMVPVKPLKDDEGTFVTAYRARLPSLYAKIKP